jgi:hypothetical protein
MAQVAIMPNHDNMAISHIAIKQVIWPIWVSMEKAIEMQLLWKKVKQIQECYRKL